jgi:hypothetical protein
MCTTRLEINQIMLRRRQILLPQQDLPHLRIGY